MNDPEEGEIFFKLVKDKFNFKIDEIFYKEKSVSSAHIGSFVRIEKEDKEEKLFLWRTYGKQDGIEASGACLIFKPSNFSSQPVSTLGVLSPLEGSKLKESNPKRYSLFKVIYESEITEKKGESTEESNIKELKRYLRKVKEILKYLKGKEETYKVVREILDEIRFLFKADHYKEEKEARVVVMSYGGKQEVDYEKLPPSFYMENPKDVIVEKSKIEYGRD